ncbi:TetR/AcrR family transcriptional regulator [Streptomyces sp. WAC 01325]|uniref:TetR/AcrR family transcriptional regulator C-terminal ligand-binding domain-containing protein n=1 Tax=Streptomyces chartreusis TaxID=1969 RepID=A0A7H8T1N2_STRCX|nr:MULTISPECIES: TetR/AcrR family transcriptional regulator [Streptomyces]WCH96737.1 TetR/AcrR family transcriptional regulator C-terminal ligand-binding domain-containing protein [Streptomyces moderatus]QEV66413.1 TetR/AcrR family transcriptional regulator [Streptomyces chartreusis]QKZ17284.1 TetR/AcrR family transcriptional regulator C-terminal ligand-binding domain-containing protein [Streptomyces chartreusis]RSM86744.1 TetR/AcrR family transcriptional regulator [Streptomyces sp. WAC 01325]
MTSQAADGPETVAASRRSKITPEREQEFFDAVLEQVRACGYDSVTMEGVAATTRCSKATLYRQWKTKPQFVAAALRASRQTRFDGIDTGTLADDLREAARAAGAWSAKDTRLLQALGHAVMEDPELKKALREALIDPEIDALRQILRRGVERGEVAADNPALEYIPAQIFGVLRARPVLEGEDADPEYIVRFVEAAVLPTLGLT